MADVFESRADKTKGLVFVSLFNLIDPLDGFLVHDIAADAVIRVGRIDDDTAPFENFKNDLNESFLRVYGIDFNQHEKPSLLRQGTGCQESKLKIAKSAAIL